MRTKQLAFLVCILAFCAGLVVTTTFSGCGQPAPVSDSPDDVDTDTDAAVAEPADEGADASDFDGSVEPAEEEPEQAGGEAEADEAPSPDLSAVDKSANADIKPGDWPQWAGTSYRNNVPEAVGIPTSWNVGKFDRRTGEWIKDEAVNIKWVANLGSQSYGNPVVAGGKIYVGTNNSAGYLPRYPSEIDLGCLVCFNEEDGKFLWQHSSEKLLTGRVHDWPLQGVCCAPYVEGDRVWFVTSRGEVRCLDAEGYYDGEDDGPEQGAWALLFDIMSAEDPATDRVAPAVAELEEGKVSDDLRQLFSDRGAPLPNEAAAEVAEAGKRWTIAAEINGAPRELELKLAGPKLSAFKRITVDDKDEADVVWVYNMMEELGVSQHNMAACSVTAMGDILFVCTSNGVDETHINIPSIDSPSFLAMDKNTGKVLWSDGSPGANILHGQWSSPALGVLGGVPQVLFAGGDGWLYSFRADQGKDGRPEFLWRFDCNPKESKWVPDGRGTRNNLIATPVIYDGLVYVAVGQDPEHGEGIGHLWCINPQMRGDVSPTLAVKVQDRSTPIPHRRLQAVIPEDGEVAIDNPNSAAIWHYSTVDHNGDGAIDFEEEMHRSIGTVCIKDDVLCIADYAGLFHCLNAKTGKVYWTYDMLAASWGSPLIVDGHVYIGDEDGDVSVFRLSGDPNEAMKKEEGSDEYQPLEEIQMRTSVYSTPVVANGVLYISTKDKLFAIKKPSDAAE